MSDVTRILNAIERGDAGATDELLPLVYEELRLLAAQKLSREPPGQTLQATALVHEAYLRLTGDAPQDWNGRGHFFAAAAEAMRRILVESARRKQSTRRGGNRRRVELDAWNLATKTSPEDLLVLDEALSALGAEDPVTADLIKLRYFAGLSLEQAAGILEISPRTAARYWAYGRVWLLRRITGSDGSAAP
jgi:RNA polymerase sigma factor (TIGR02999 family)